MSFQSLWNSNEAFELPEERLNACIFAQKFSEWTKELIARAANEPSIPIIQVSKAILADRYFLWRSVVPRSHRNRLGDPHHHWCVFHAFAEAYEGLRALELALMPPLLFAPSPPTPSPPPMNQIAGIFLGALDK